ncbi:UvrB/UvrC motif-containing protein [Lederbergia graminis]|uniref:UvrB/UvrC motif-containing protein n=1 Tax=Lederbergia graminis TaxID=735518 RepID=A0ABW0LKL4_9BACI|nr:UvrB/UvrC motif-containing protein [Paenibacillus bovis]HLU22563.1 UvrB/UvrC motif-containing protein [Bacillaceae bacterium]
MICQECNERPATLHFTNIVNGEKTVIQLCEKCAKEKGELFFAAGTSGFSFNDLLAGFLNLDPALQQAKSQPLTQGITQCDACEMTFQQFIKVGRFGCPHCYKAFSRQISPILQRVQSGNTVHGGRVPKRIGGSIHIKKEIQNLKEELRTLVENEEFEKAAEVRDQIRSLENNLKNEEGNR